MGRCESEVGRGRNNGGINLKHTVSTYVNITMYPPYNDYMLTKNRQIKRKKTKK
jgi:hypothetical protein